MDDNYTSTVMEYDNETDSWEAVGNTGFANTGY
jgi:hypothetical protein